MQQKQIKTQIHNVPFRILQYASFPWGKQTQKLFEIRRDTVIALDIMTPLLVCVWPECLHCIDYRGDLWDLISASGAVPEIIH